jgi:hypothetical protein
MLLRFKACFTGRLLTEAQKSPNLVPKLGECAIIIIVDFTN